ncbi:MAG: PD40 domain-containing protein [Myxococcales bacterium]|nr:PD40 domain-containing protein [Myxococcales bacterium]
MMVRISLLARIFSLLVLFGLVLTASPKAAHGHDGAIRWHTLSTQHVRVHYPLRLAVFAARVAATAQEAVVTLQPLLSYRPPRPIQLTIDDYADASNGFASSFPFDHVHIRAYPPAPMDDLSGNGDWLRGLVFHEVAHIFHLGKASGLSTAINAVFGRTWLPNQFLPRFWVEGFAVHMETRYPGGDKAVRGRPGKLGRGGRAEGARYMARLRGALRDGTWPSLPQLVGSPVRWPRGRSWYLFGSWLLDYQARKFGHTKLQRFIQGYGGRVVPYGINTLYRQTYGRSIRVMWRQATAALRRRVQLEQRLRRRGLVPPRNGDGMQTAVSTLGSSAGDGESARASALPAPAERLTQNSQWRGRVRWMPDNKHVVCAHAPADGLAQLELVNPVTKAMTVLRRCELDCDDATPSPDGRWLLWTATRPVGRLYQRKEIMAARLHKGTPKRLGTPIRLGTNMRARDLSVSGRWLLWVAVRDDGRTEIRSAELTEMLRAAQRGTRSPRPRPLILAPGLDVVLGSPVLTDDGRLYWTAGAGGQRHIMVRKYGAGWHPQGPAKPVVARGVAGIAEVRGFTPIPATVRWVSDLTWRRVRGLPTLSAVVQLGNFRDAATLAVDTPGATWRMASWTQTGVTSTSIAPNGRPVAAITGGHGLDLYRLPLPPTRAPVTAPVAALPSIASLRYAPQTATAPSRPYRTLRQSWPRSWTPIVQYTPAPTPQLTLGLEVAAHDPLELFSWQLQAQSDLEVDQALVIASFSLARYEPLWTLNLAWVGSSGWATSGWSAFALPTEQWIGRLGGAWRYPYARGGWTMSWGWRASLIRLRNERAEWQASVVPEEPFGPLPYRSFTGKTSSVDLAISYDRSERYPDSSVTERRRSLTLNISVDDPLLGSDLRQSHVDLRGRWTFALGGHRALELRSKAGWAPTYNPSAPPFALSGLPPVDMQALLYAGASGDFGVVRGVVSPVAGGRWIAGRALAWGSAALHLPLPAFGTGFDLLPVFLGRTWLSLFSDGARIWAGEEGELRHGTSRSGWAASAGAELAIALETAFVAQGSLRLGWARAFGDVRSQMFYVRLGP